MRKPYGRIILALLVALAAGITTAALQPTAIPARGGLFVAGADASRAVSGTAPRPQRTGATDPSLTRQAMAWAAALVTDTTARR